MMHIVVDNHDALESVVVKGVACGDCYIIEEAEAHGGFVYGVMPGGTYQAVGVVYLSFHNGVNGGEWCACGFDGGFIGLCRDVGVCRKKASELVV
jgi:hypothetical protein